VTTSSKERSGKMALTNPSFIAGIPQNGVLKRSVFGKGWASPLGHRL
jgi:hypothetical protein